MEKMLMDALEKFLVDMKADIEKDGMIPTLDEAITRLQASRSTL